jgi:hypothetical protein
MSDLSPLWVKIINEVLKKRKKTDPAEKQDICKDDDHGQ